MAVARTELEQKIYAHLRDKVQTQTATFTPQNLEGKMKREGTESVDDYFTNLAGGLINAAGVDLKQTLTSTVFQPVLLDPNVYNQGTLYNISPLVTYLEQKGRRQPAGSTKEEFIQMTAPFIPEWIGETSQTSGDGTPGVTNGNAVVYVEALPMSFSDLLAFGQGATSKAQLMQFAQEALREGFNQAIISGANATNNNQMDGLFTIMANCTSPKASYRINNSGQPVTVAQMDNLDAGLTDINKGYATFALTTRTVLNQLKQDMQKILHLSLPPYQITAGQNISAYTGPNGDIPIIADSQVPNVATKRLTDSLMRDMFSLRT